MQPGRSNWRDQAAYDYLDDLAAPDLGWECLRRNPEYQHDYAKLAGEPPERVDLMDQVGRRWGLCFPDPARAARLRCGGVLVSGGRYRCRGARCRPRGTGRRGRRPR